MYVFGSVARGSANAESDIDLLFEADTSRHFSLLDQAKLQIELADVLGRPVDLFERDALRHRVRQQAEREILQVF